MSAHTRCVPRAKKPKVARFDAMGRPPSCALAKRNECMLQQYKEGVTTQQLARKHSISRRRVQQVILQASGCESGSMRHCVLRNMHRIARARFQTRERRAGRRPCPDCFAPNTPRARAAPAASLVSFAADADFPQPDQRQTRQQQTSRLRDAAPPMQRGTPRRLPADFVVGIMAEARASAAAARS